MYLLNCVVIDNARGGGAHGKASEWKRKSKELGISISKISRPTRVVLNALKKRGLYVYTLLMCIQFAMIPFFFFFFYLPYYHFLLNAETMVSGTGVTATGE